MHVKKCSVYIQAFNPAKLPWWTTRTEFPAQDATRIHQSIPTKACFADGRRSSGNENS
ncbi:hypothetical protein H6G76_36110 [Nostoc sp. FACHB-152]|nr:hypothetical protein [Nostoc sp. FACHB-152]